MKLQKAVIFIHATTRTWNIKYYVTSTFSPRTEVAGKRSSVYHLRVHFNTLFLFKFRNQETFLTKGNKLLWIFVTHSTAVNFLQTSVNRPHAFEIGIDHSWSQVQFVHDTHSSSQVHWEFETHAVCHPFHAPATWVSLSFLSRFCLTSVDVLLVAFYYEGHFYVRVPILHHSVVSASPRNVLCTSERW